MNVWDGWIGWVCSFIDGEMEDRSEDKVDG